ncbi:MAG: M20/M25/M40 family metallo-hydrolase [Patescibacteria group bacterium]
MLALRFALAGSPSIQASLKKGVYFALVVFVTNWYLNGSMLDNNYLKMLGEFVSFRSVSTDRSYIEEIEKTVFWLKQLFEAADFKVEIFKGLETNPVVFASINNNSKETILVYGHYDVQPALKEDGWDGEPFKVEEKNGRLVARGVVDNKGQILIHIFTVLKLIKEGKLKYNVKFLIEGNEETSNPEIGEIIKKNKGKLISDYILVSDGEVVSGKPTIEYSLRGGCNLTLKFKTANNNLHSGIYGGAVPNAAYELSKFLAKLFDKDNKVAIPGFYKGVDKITSEQVKNNSVLFQGKKSLFSSTGVKALLTEVGIDFHTQTGLRPTLQVTGIKTGYTGEGYANIIPATAEARINFRTVVSQKEEVALKAFKDFANKNVPKYVDYEISHSVPYGSVKIDISSQKVKEVKKLLKDAFQEEVLVKPVGGGIPVVLDFKEILGVDTLLVSLGNDDCNMHGANENFNIELLEKGLKFSEAFFRKA